jgi:hypothetical protein
MQNSKTKSAKSANAVKTTLPGVRDWREPVECRGHDLAAVIASAQAAGFHGHTMTVADVAVYRLQFFRLAGTAEAGKHFRQPSETTVTASNSGVPASFYAPFFQ